MELTINTPINNAFVFNANPYEDERGFFYRAFCDNELGKYIDGKTIKQINISKTNEKGAIRGLHYQHKPDQEIKLIRCIKGKVWDVIVDLRSDSSSFMQWYGVELEPENKNMIIVPEGCAHGFQVLEPGSELLYLHTAFL